MLVTHIYIRFTVDSHRSYESPIQKGSSDEFAYIYLIQKTISILVFIPNVYVKQILNFFTMFLGLEPSTHYPEYNDSKIFEIELNRKKSS